MTRQPVPGKPVRGSATGEPINALLDLLGRRWAMRIVWELRSETLNFRDLQERCGGVSSSVLNDRIGELRRARVIEQAQGGYGLADEGRELLEIFTPLMGWAQRWAKRSGVEHAREPD